MAEEPSVGVTVDASADPDALARLEAAIAGVVSAGVRTAFKTFDDPGLRKRIDSSIEPAFRGIRTEGTAAAKAVKTVSQDVTALVRDLNSASKEGVRFTSSMKQIGSAATEVVSATLRARTSERAIEITRREELSREAQLRLQIVKGENSRINIATQAAAQSQLISTRTAGKQRVLVTQEFLRTIGRLERGLGVTLTGLARTTTSAISKAFSGLGSLLRRSNNDFTDGLRPALRRREELMSTSFSKQERVVRESITRQERQLTELRTLSSKGVLGAVSGRGIGVGIAGLGAGIGIASQVSAGYRDAINFREQVNKNKVVFGEFADVVLKFASNAPSELGATSAAVLEATGTFGNLFRAIGLNEGTSTQLSVSLTKIATDISSFNNVSVDEVFTNLRAGLVGEAEPLRKFGIDVSDARLKHEAFLLGISDGKSVLTAGQKAQAAYAAIVKDSALAEGDFARTADEGANAARRRSAATTQLFSTISGKFIPLITALNVALVNVTSGVIKFINGEVGPGLLVLRDGLIGAAAGLAAIVAAKAGVEILQSLGAVVKLAVTPMGLLVVAAVGIGAAFSILSKRSPEVRKVFSDLADRLRDVYESAKGKLLPFLERIADVVTNTVIPAIGRFANYLLDHAVSAFRRTVGFLRDEVLPVLKVIASFVTEKLTTAFVFVTGTAVRFFNSVKPLIQPAIDGFIVLGKAVRGALSGDFSGLRLGATSAVSGLGAAISNIVGKIGELLTPIAAKIATFFVELFSGPNIKKYISGVLNFVEGIGRVLGTIVSSPIFLKAVAALAAAAVVVGFRFIKGVGEGIISNLPGILGGLGSLLVAGLKKIFTSPLLLTGIIAFASLGPALLKVFRAFGTGAGTEFSKGLAGSVKAGISGARGGLAALFGGTSGAIGFNARADNRAFRKDQQSLINQTRILGGDVTLISPRSIDESKAQLAKLSEGLTKSQLDALRWRDSLQQGAIGVKGAFTGLVTAAKGIGPLLAAPVKSYFSALNAVVSGRSGTRAFVTSFADSFRQGGAAIRNGIKDALGAVERYSISRSQSIGRTIANGLQKGAQVGLAAVGGFTAGKAAGESGGGAAFPALTAGLTGLAIGGPVVGAVAAGASLIGSAFGAAGREAKLMKERVKELTATLKTDIKEAVDAGTLSLAKLNAGALGVSDVAGLAGVKDAFATALGPEGLKVLDSFGLAWQRNLVPILKSGGDADQLKARLRGAFLDAASASGQFTTAFGSNASKVQSLVASLLQSSNDGSFADLISSATTFNTSGVINNRDFLDALGAQKPLLVGLINTANELNRAAIETSASLDGVNVSGRFFAEPPKNTGKSLYGRAIVDAKEFIDLAAIIEARHNAALTKVSADIDRYTARLDIAKAAQDNLFNIPGDTDLQALIDNALIGVQGVGGRIANLIAGGEDPTGANVRNAIRGIGDEIESVIKGGVDKGLVVDADTARFITQGIFDAAVAGLPKDSQAFKDAAAAYEAFLSAVEPTVDKIRAEDAAVQLHKEIQDYLSNHPVSIDVAATIVSLRDDAIGRLKINSNGGALPAATPTAGPYVPPTPPTSTDRSLRGESVQITQVFNERVDTRAAAADIAWRLGVS